MSTPTPLAAHLAVLLVEDNAEADLHIFICACLTDQVAGIIYFVQSKFA